MPEKSSRYPPIHDQIDTPTDFSMAVWKQQQRRDGSRSQRWKQSRDELSKKKATTNRPQDRLWNHHSTRDR